MTEEDIEEEVNETAAKKAPAKAKKAATAAKTSAKKTTTKAKIETEDISEKDDIPASLDVGSIKDTKSTDLDPLSLKDYLFPKERPWVWKSFAVMFVLFFGYYYIKYKSTIS
ncbi:MAG: hypothetical protein NZ736_07965 [Candidatus Poseidoniaceae archaeon]|nr:hypothetical protein [Candidatus Poseidoniaceae archaeon]